MFIWCGFSAETGFTAHKLLLAKIHEKVWHLEMGRRRCGPDYSFIFEDESITGWIDHKFLVRKSHACENTYTDERYLLYLFFTALDVNSSQDYQFERKFHAVVLPHQRRPKRRSLVLDRYQALPQKSIMSVFFSTVIIVDFQKKNNNKIKLPGMDCAAWQPKCFSHVWSVSSWRPRCISFCDHQNTLLGNHWQNEF